MTPPLHQSDHRHRSRSQSSQSFRGRNQTSLQRNEATRATYPQDLNLISVHQDLTVHSVQRQNAVPTRLREVPTNLRRRRAIWLRMRNVRINASPATLAERSWTKTGSLSQLMSLKLLPKRCLNKKNRATNPTWKIFQVTS